MALLEKNIMKPRDARSRKREEKEFDERILQVSRVSRVAKGGRRIRFRALVVIGDKKGRVGVGLGKSAEVQSAVTKATSRAKKNLITVPIIHGTIPHEITAKDGAAVVMLRPASEGTSMVAGGSVRTVLELAGVTDILAKIMGSRSMVNNVRATIKALSSFSPAVVEKLKVLEERSIRRELPKEETVEATAEIIAEEEIKKDVKEKVKEVKKDNTRKK